MQVLADDKQLAAVIDRLADEVRAMMKNSPGPWAFVGIRSRGDLIATVLADRLKPDHHGTLDIALYRDDLSEIGAQPVVRTTEINFPVDGANILLIDDVLMSGRSIRAALQSLLDFGRPRCVKLLVLVDRGGRELPIAPDLVGLRVNTDRTDRIDVLLKPQDARNAVLLIPRPEAKA